MNKERQVVLLAVCAWWAFWVAGGFLAAWAEGDWSYLTLLASVGTGGALFLWVLLHVGMRIVGDD